VAGAGDGYEEHVATAHGLDFAHAAALYGLDHVRVADPERFREAIDAGLASPRSTLVHVRTDRAENVALHRAVWEAVRTAV
jgi:2-succinyl-5-enolpyruvyl-6-hydroxy-3-cyclohexene-1-carboxylate synthase